VIAALRRRLDEMKQQLTAKDQELRRKQREVDRLDGKLAETMGRESLYGTTQRV